MEVILYVTDSCSLCDEALDLLLNSNTLNGITLSVLDIVHDDALLQDLAERIPVVEVAGSQVDWPFSAEDVRKLVESE